MDLSAVIFVVLALAWALYLVPKALKRSDALAGERPVEEYSDRLRVLVRTRRRPTPAEESALPAEESGFPAEESVVRTRRARRVATPRPLISRAAAARAVRRRRRVLGGLVLVLAVVAALAAAAVLPWWSLAVPAVLIVGFLVVARFSVRGQTSARVTTPAAGPVTALVEEAAVEFVEEVSVPEAPPAEPVAVAAPAPAPVRRVDDVQEAIAAEGSLWDPLPMTLPTYVDKPAARRTVRTIELTGMTSSGHDATDSAIADQARESQRGTPSEDPARRAVGE